MTRLKIIQSDFMNYWYKFWEKSLDLELVIGYLPLPIWKKLIIPILKLQLFIQLKIWGE